MKAITPPLSRGSIPRRGQDGDSAGTRVRPVIPQTLPCFVPEVRPRDDTTADYALADAARARSLGQFRSSASYGLLRWDSKSGKISHLVGFDTPVQLEGFRDHWHSHRALEISYVERGEGTRLVGDSRERFQAGDLVIIGPDVPHHWRCDPKAVLLVLHWDWPADHPVWQLPESTALHPLFERINGHAFAVEGRAAADLGRRIRQLARLSGLSGLAFLLETLASLAGAAGDLRPLARLALAPTRATRHEEAMRRATSYLMAKHHEALRLPEVLRFVGMSRATFNRRFRAYTGRSFSKYLNEIRLQAVCRDLDLSGKPVSRAAFDHGFNNLSFFNRSFRATFGVTPTVYRRNCQSAAWPRPGAAAPSFFPGRVARANATARAN